MPHFTTPTSFRHANPTVPYFSVKNPTLPGMGISQTQLMSTVSSPPPPHSSHPALPHLAMLVFEAVLEVICVSLPGYIVARQGMFTSEMQKFTANLNVTLFTPCLSKRA